MADFHPASERHVLVWELISSSSDPLLWEEETCIVVLLCKLVFWEGSLLIVFWIPSEPAKRLWTILKLITQNDWEQFLKHDFRISAYELQVPLFIRSLSKVLYSCWSKYRLIWNVSRGKTQKKIYGLLIFEIMQSLYMHLKISSGARQSKHWSLN